ncbi:hypothetical protein [Paracoccus litorisediminis]|uniref:Uncharacterized protein n=1 Tax=Paracoccus litorisediminis TaxID=2006130 RepID=A0A844HMS7_9RHOB|nr:hypothetical protein [Paracoccus litorisediminis]MTH61220.1 hypothetical protein [Paracoccus litorisediminis]
MRETLPKKSSRRFSKWVMGVNIALTWGLIYLAVIYGQTEQVVPGALALIGSLFGLYTGVGHLDMRKAAQLSIDHLTKNNRVHDA